MGRAFAAKAAPTGIGAKARGGAFAGAGTPRLAGGTQVAWNTVRPLRTPATLPRLDEQALVNLWTTVVVPAKAGIQRLKQLTSTALDSRLRGMTIRNGIVQSFLGPLISRFGGGDSFWSSLDHWSRG